jgi:hypothetical protein
LDTTQDWNILPVKPVGVKRFNVESADLLEFLRHQTGGLESSPGAFVAVSSASLALGALAFGVAHSAVHGGWGSRPAQRARLDDMQALHALLEDMPAIEFTLASLVRPRAAAAAAAALAPASASSRAASHAAGSAALPARQVTMMRSEFSQMLASETGRRVSEREIDLVFDLFDRDDSDSIEIGELVHFLGPKAAAMLPSSP